MVGIMARHSCVSFGKVYFEVIEYIVGGLLVILCGSAVTGEPPFQL